MVTVELSGVERFSLALKALGERQKAATEATVNTVLEKGSRQTRTKLSLGWHPPGTQTGSVPPQPPWRITGELSRSVKVERARRLSEGTWEGRLGPTAVYARIQELGGRTGRGHRTVLPARPYLRPAWAIVKPVIRSEFIKAWSNAQSSR
jgi:hypothetical protein